MKEKEKSPWLAPSCASLKPRLYQIGVTEFSGEPCAPVSGNGRSGKENSKDAGSNNSVFAVQ